MTVMEMAEIRKKELKKCGVCGDNALGSNFNAITCESCKAFFRRNALKTKIYQCPFDDNCKVDVVTRRFCQKCRLKKCFEIGMKKEWIQTDDEKKAKRDKIQQNKEKKSKKKQDAAAVVEHAFIKVESPEPISQMLLSPLTPQTPSNSSVENVSSSVEQRLFSQPLTPSDCEYSPPAKLSIIDYTGTSPSHVCEANLEETNTDMYEECLMKQISFPKCDENMTPKLDSHLEYDPFMSNISTNDNEKSGNNLCVNGSLSSFDGILGKPQLKRASSCENIPQSVYDKAVSVEFSDFPLRSVQIENPKELNTLEKEKLHELITANEVLKMPLNCGITDPSLIDVINLTDYAIRRLIKMSKKISAFMTLCQTDQIALLKGGCTELMILRSVMSYDPEKDCWCGPQGPAGMSIKVDILKEARGNVYEEHKRFINSFKPKWRNDENIMLILSGIALFTPERPNILHKEVIKLEQDTYYYLLRRYVETIFPPCEAKSCYLCLVHRIQELHILNENHIQVYLDVNPKDVEPLLIEIFDLKY